MKKSSILNLLANIFFFLFLLVSSVNLSAQGKLSVQGLLKKSDGTSLPDGNYDLTFRFYLAETGGSALEAVTINTEVNGGVYSAVLSGFTTINFSEPYYVSVSVNGGTELLPRIALTAAPYALSLQGQSNKFPSSGKVNADAIDVAGALNASSVAASGNVGGATVSATGAVNAGSVTASGAVSAGSVSTSGAVSAGSVSASGAVTAGRMLVPGGNPNAGVAGAGYSFGAGGDQDGGLFSAGDDNVALYANQVKAVEANHAGVTIPGYVHTGTGYFFSNDDDSGMYSGGDGTLAFKVNGETLAWGNTGGFNISKVLYLTSAPNMTDGDNLEWRSNVQGGRVGVNTSSRRYKYNIQPFQTDFTRILQLQPRIYNRKSESPDVFEIGYIAEEVDSLGLKNLVLYDEQGRPNSLIYKKFVLYTNEVVKMHHAEIEKLKSEVAALQAEKNALDTENASLRADIKSQQADFGKRMDEFSRRLKSLETAASNR